MYAVRYLIDCWFKRKPSYGVEQLWDYAQRLVDVYTHCNDGAVPESHELKMLAEVFQPQLELVELPQQLSSLQLHERYWQLKCRSHCAKLIEQGKQCDEKKLVEQAACYAKYLALKCVFPKNPFLWEGTCQGEGIDVGLTKEQQLVPTSLTDYFAAKGLVEMAFQPEQSKAFRDFFFHKALNGCIDDERRPVRAFLSQMLLKQTAEPLFKINEMTVDFMAPDGAFELAVYEGHVGIVHLLYGCLKKFIRKFPCGQRHSKMKDHLDEFVIGYRLHTAARERHSTMMEMLLDVAEAEGISLRPAIVHLLHRQDLNWMAESPRHSNAVRRLLSWAVDKNVDLVDFFHPEGSDYTFLEAAVSKGNEKLIEFLVEFATSNHLNHEMILLTKKASLIHRAARIGTEPIVQLILAFASGWDVAMLFQPDERGRTPLHYAASNSDERVIDKMLRWTKEKGVDLARALSIDEAGRTPMHAAAENQHLAVVTNLVQFSLGEGFDLVFLLAPDNQGQTPVHVAASKGNDAVVEFLLAKSADQEIDANFLLRPDNDGLTALHLAASAGHRRTVQLILKFALGHDSLLANLCSIFTSRITNPPDGIKDKKRPFKSILKLEKREQVASWQDSILQLIFY